MSISLGAAAVGALAALVFAGLLARRCIRAPRLATVALLFAAAALTVALGAVTVVGAVVLATDPLSSAAFSKAWPSASVHYQIIPNGVLKFVAVLTALAAVISLIVTGVRARQSPGWQTLFLAVAAIAVATVLLDVMRVKLPGDSVYAAICLAAAALAWFAAGRANAVRLESLRSGGFAWDEDTGSFVRYRDEDTGDFGYADDTGGFRRSRGETGARGWY